MRLQPAGTPVRTVTQAERERNAARRLSRQRYRMAVAVAKKRRLAIERRHQLIRDLRTQGLSWRAIAAEVGCGMTLVASVLKPEAHRRRKARRVGAQGGGSARRAEQLIERLIQGGA